MLLLLLSRARPGRAGPGLNFDGQGRADKKRSYRAGPGRAGPGRAEKFRPVQDSSTWPLGYQMCPWALDAIATAFAV